MTYERYTPERFNDGRQTYGLSAQEMRVLELMTEGLADKEIAAQLGVTPYTVNKQVGSILRKMDSPSRTGAAVKAVRRGLLAAGVVASVLAALIALDAHRPLKE